MKHEAFCTHCGHKGFVIHSSDDWGRSEMSYEGVENEPPDRYAVGRKRAEPRDMRPRCECGSLHIRRGALLKSG